MNLTAEQLQALGRAFHAGEVVGCPNCNAKMFCEAAPYMGKASIDVLFVCRRCGAEGRFEPTDAEDQWTAAEMRAIVDAYFREERGLCPRDRARLSFSPVSFSVVHAFCPYCGRKFTSSEEQAAVE